MSISPTSSGALLLGAQRDTTLQQRIISGQYPRVEYLDLCDKYKLDLVTFDDVSQTKATWLRLISRRLGSYWSLALLGRFQQKRWPHLLTTGEDLGLPLLLLRRLTGGHQQVAVIVHGSYFGSPRFRRVIALLRSATHVRFLCLSDSLTRQLVDSFGVAPERVITVGYGVDTDFFTPTVAATPASASSLPPIAAAGLAKRDYRTFIQAVSLLGRLDVPVKIAADSAWFQSKLDIDDTLPAHVEVRSYGDYVGLRQLYADSAFVVVPLHEAKHACGYAVIAEAMAMEKPVITTCITGHSDYIIEGETGFYVPVGNAPALHDRMRFLLDNPTVAREMGRKARQHIVSNFSLDAYVQRIAEAAHLALRH